jgi:hypothetical protein
MTQMRVGVGNINIKEPIKIKGAEAGKGAEKEKKVGNINKKRIYIFYI